MDLLLLTFVVAVLLPAVFFVGYREGRKAVPFFVSRVTLKEGDQLVLSTELAISDAVARRLKEDVEKVFEGHKCLVLGDGLKLGVLGQDET